MRYFPRFLHWAPMVALLSAAAVSGLSLLLPSLLWPSESSAAELRDAAIVAGASGALTHPSGLRLEGPELSGLGRTVLVPEPGFLWQLGPGLALVGMLHHQQRSCRRKL